MTIIYQEFDCTQANIYTELVNRITAHPDWASVTPTPLTVTLTGSLSSSGTTVTVASTAGLLPGQRIRFPNNAVRTVTAVTSETTFTINANIGGTAAIGATVTTETLLVKATTTRGADMILDLQAGDPSTEFYRLSLRFWQQMPADYATASPLDAVDRYLYFRPSGGAATQTLHVTLSVSKEHLFVAVEGPRAQETGTHSTTYGSLKNYLFFSDVVPYHGTDDTPVVVASSGTVATAAASVNSQAHLADLSRNYFDDESWPSCRLASLSFPTCQTVDTVSVERDCVIDGKKYLFPYVVFSNKEGIRGRLLRFFYAGTTQPSSYADQPAPVGEKVTFDGVVYKLIAVNKSDGNNDAWGAFGAADNGTTQAGRSVVVAVPMAEAA